MTDEILDPAKEIKNPRFNAGDGIALCASWTGYGANNFEDKAIMLKQKDQEGQMDLRKAYRHVRVTLSMEDFLKKFFNLWYDDARVLASVLGYEIEEDEYESEYYQEKMKDTVDSIELLKSIKTEEDFFKLDNAEQDVITALQVKFEKGLQSESISESNKVEKSTSIVNDDKNSENGEDEIMSEQLAELEKQAADLKKMLEDERAARKAADEKALIKEKEGILSKVADVSFLEEGTIEMLKGKDVETITSVVGLLVKAQDLIKEKEDKIKELEKKADTAEDTFMNKAHTVDGEADDGAPSGGLASALKKMNQYVETA